MYLNLDIIEQARDGINSQLEEFEQTLNQMNDERDRLKSEISWSRDLTEKYNAVGKYAGVLKKQQGKASYGDYVEWEKEYDKGRVYIEVQLNVLESRDSKLSYDIGLYNGLVDEFKSFQQYLSDLEQKCDDFRNRVVSIEIDVDPKYIKDSAMYLVPFNHDFK